MNQNYKKLSSLSRSESNLSYQHRKKNSSSRLERLSCIGLNDICTKREVGSKNDVAERDVDEFRENRRRIETVKHGYDLQTDISTT